MTKRVLLLIDPQNDFCEVQLNLGMTYIPKLPVTGALADMTRVARFIEAAPEGYFDTVVVTLDSHPQVGIERPNFWKDSQGNSPAPFTKISAQDVLAGKFVPVDAGAKEQVVQYLKALKKAGKYEHTVWPVHCVDGTEGAAIVEVIAQALNAKSVGQVVYVKKGQNPMTEHYSAVKAEVPIAADPATDVNQTLVDIAKGCDELFVAGEASSHCVKSTVEDLVAIALNGDASRLKIIANGMSPVYGCEHLHEKFIDDVTKAGARVVTIEGNHVVA